MPTTEAPRTSRHEHARDGIIDATPGIMDYAELAGTTIMFILGAIALWPLALVAGVAYLVYKVSGMSDVVAEARAAKSVEG